MNENVVFSLKNVKNSQNVFESKDEIHIGRSSKKTISLDFLEDITFSGKDIIHLVKSEDHSLLLKINLINKSGKFFFHIETLDQKKEIYIPLFDNIVDVLYQPFIIDNKVKQMTFSFYSGNEKSTATIDVDFELEQHALSLNHPNFKIKNYDEVIECFNIMIPIFDKNLKDRYLILFGIVLGLIRNNKIIDDEIDIGIFFEDIEKFKKVKNELLLNGFKICKVSTDENGFRQIKFDYKNVSIDIYVHFEIEEWYIYYGYYNQTHKICDEYRIKKELLDYAKRIEVPGISSSLRIPRETFKYLNSVYRDSWIIPNTEWKQKDELTYFRSVPYFGDLIFNPDDYDC